MLRDRLICGINDARIQRRLLAEAKVDFKRAMEIAQAMEIADRDATDLQGLQKELTPTEAAVRVARKPQGVERSRPYANCHRCGGRHKPSQCKFKEAECYACGKKGHISKACRSKYKGKREQPINNLVRDQAATTNAVCSEVEEDVYTMFQLTNSRNDPLYITVSVNQVPIKMEIDTGATLTVISESTYRQVWTKEQADDKDQTSHIHWPGDPSQRITTGDGSTWEPTESTTPDCYRRTRTQPPGQKLAGRIEVRLEGHVQGVGNRPTLSRSGCT